MNSTKYYSGLVSFALVFAICFCGCDSQKTNETAGSNTKASEKADVDQQDSAIDSEKETAEDEVADGGDSAAADAGEDSGKPLSVEVADGAVTFAAPATWKVVEPKSSMIEYEISVPMVEGEVEDATDGRLTIMRAGGDVQANIDRWYGQYTQPDGSATKDNSTVTDMVASDCDIKLVDITGTLQDRPMGGGPFSGGKTIERENYRMLAAIIQTGEFGQYFVKLYGPAKTIDANEQGFKDMIKSLSVELEKGESL